MAIVSLLLVLQIYFVIYQTIQFRNLKKRQRASHHKFSQISQKQLELSHELSFFYEKQYERLSLPNAIANLPFSDQMIRSIHLLQIPPIYHRGLSFVNLKGHHSNPSLNDLLSAVLRQHSSPLRSSNLDSSEAPQNHKTQAPRGIVVPYNGSLIEKGDGYLLFFRYDTPSIYLQRGSFFSQIGCIELQSDFTPIESSFSIIDTKSRFSEDPRIFSHNGDYFLLYSDLKQEMRGLRLAQIDLKTRELTSITHLCTDSRRTEKNWTPFSWKGDIYFLHTIAPLKVFRLFNSDRDVLSPVEGIENKKLVAFWSERWGIPRGGTSAQLLNDEYLAFFHSSFEERNGRIWYVMGAYTFAAEPPFQLLRMSQYPILFQGIYETTHRNTARPRIRTIYPVGFVCRGDEIHLSCGENDSAIKVVTMDKRRLLESLVLLESVQSASIK